jgi:voltage-gated potassium channel
MRFRYMIGLGGVCKLESSSVRHLGKIFDYLMLAVAIGLLLQWHFEIQHLIDWHLEQLINWSIWGYFVLQFFVLFFVVHDKWRYLRQNWFIALIVLIGVPQLFSQQHIVDIFYHDLRPLLALALLMPWFGLIKHSLTDDKLSTTLLTVFFTVIIVGFLISGIDSGIKNPIQGIWWAWVTMSTVGYGDYVPLDVGGRIFASIVILMGLCFFAVLTANFSSMFVRRHVRRFRTKESQDVAKLVSRLNEVEKRDEQLVELLEKIERRLAELDK